MAKYQLEPGAFVQSTFDDDLYKITMQNAVISKFPDARVKYVYKVRSDHKFPSYFAHHLQYIVNQTQELEPPKGGIDWLEKKAKFIPLSFIYFLDKFRLNPHEVQLFQKDDELLISIEGSYFSAIRWEVILMAIISELYFKMTGNGTETLDFEKVEENAAKKASFLVQKNVQFSDFGTRRRHSYQVQETVVDSLKRYGRDMFVGTSNLHIAHKLDTKFLGTTAHEWYQFNSAVYGYRQANYMAMQNWSEVYKGSLGTVLPDTFTLDAFLPSFNSMFARLYDGTRWDSGDFRTYTNKIVEHYKSLNIDPLSKLIVYSNSIDSIETCVQIADYAKMKGIKHSLGIGTWFTNDVGVKPINHVIKLSKACIQRDGEKWFNVVKISDDKGKEIGDPQELELAKKSLGIDEKI